MFGDFIRKAEIPPCKEHTPTTPHFIRKSANYKGYFNFNIEQIKFYNITFTNALF